MTNTLISSDRINVIRFLARLTENLPGSPIEVGVYKGGSLAEIAKALPHKTVYGFDTFKGLPSEDHGPGEIHSVGDFNDTAKDEVAKYLMEKEGVINFKLIEGLFPESAPDIKVSFAHLDMDFYLGTRHALEWLPPRIVSGGIIVLDDYGWERCPGVKEAVDEFTKGIWGHLFSLETPVPYQCWLRMK